MLGELLSETRGKRVVRRVVSTDPPKVEVSFEDSGQVLGVPETGMGTYTSIVRPDGTMYGEGEGLIMTQDGGSVAWKGSGLGVFKERGAVSYRGILYFRTPTQNLAKLNTVAGVFEFEVDPEGKTHSKVWEWK